MPAGLSGDTLRQCVQQVLQYSAGSTLEPPIKVKKCEKYPGGEITKGVKRKFQETVELQVGIKDYDPQKDKRFNGTVQMKYCPRPNLKVCVLGDAKRTEEADSKGYPRMDVEQLKSFNKNKKLVKKFASKYSAFIAAEALIKQIPRILGPGLNKAGKFPSVLGPSDSMDAKIEAIRSNVKFQLKKVLGLGVAVGHTGMSQSELVQNISLASNFLVGLLKKNWQNIGSLGIKSTMGPFLPIF
jgi:large subunit ribosomal protein L10Ae